MVWYFDEALEAFAIVVWSLAFVFFSWHWRFRAHYAAVM
jgi:hypothetical protein